MKEKADITYNWIGRIYFVLLLLLALSYSGNKTEQYPNQTRVSIEQISETNNSAIISQGVIVPNYNNSLEISKINHSPKCDIKYTIQISEHSVNNEYKSILKHYFNLKPKILESKLIPCWNTYSLDYPLIS